MKTYTIPSYRGAISDYEDKGVAGAFKFGSALNVRKKLDTLSCNQALIDQTTTADAGVFTGMAIAFVDASDGSLYAFTNDGKIYIKVDEVWQLKYTDPDGAIKGAEQWYNSSGQAYLCWATDTKLKKKVLPGLSNWSDVTTIATNLTSAQWHTMRQANGALQICNSNLMAYVGFDGSYTPESLQLIPGNVAKTVMERQGNVAIGTVKLTNAEMGALFEWMAEALTYTKKREIPAKGVNAMVETEVTLVQAGIEGGLYYCDFISILPLVQFPGGGHVNPYGVDNYKGMSLWGVFGGTPFDTEEHITNGIYSYGRIKKNASFVLNLEYPIDCDEIGAVKVSNGVIIASYKKDNVNHIVKVDPENKADAVYQSLDMKAPPGMIDSEPVWASLEVNTLPIPEGCSIEIWYRANKDGEFIQAELEDGGTEMTAGERGVFQVQAAGKVMEIMAKLFPFENETPEILPGGMVFYFADESN